MFIDGELLKELSHKLSIELDDDVIDKLDRYSRLLVEWNSVMNLTAITEPSEIVVKHLADSISIIPLLKKQIKDKNTERLSFIDVGTGAGFPGMVVAVCCTNVDVTLLDSLNKRINFLNAVKDELGLKNVSAIHSRAEDGGKSLELREKFDVAAARAVASLSRLSEYCLPFVRVGGIFVAMKGPACEAELKEAVGAIKKLGGGMPKKHTIYIENGRMPEEKLERNIIVIDKTANTSVKYPRNPAIIKKQPL